MKIECEFFIWIVVLSVSGYYMYIEASRPRVQGDKARLLSPLFNVTSVRGPKGSGRVPYCVSFYYHMKGKHIGEYNREENNAHKHTLSSPTPSIETQWHTWIYSREYADNWF